MSWLVRVVLVVLGILAVVVGIIYLVEPIHNPYRNTGAVWATAPLAAATTALVLQK